MPSCNLIYHNIHYAKYDMGARMKVRPSLWVSLLIPGLAWCANPSTDVRDPRAGYWIEEKISSSYPQAQGLQISFADLGGGVFRYKLGANHTPENMLVVEARCDGKDYPLVDGNGKANGRMYSCRVTGPRSVESTTGHDPASPGDIVHCG